MPAGAQGVQKFHHALLAVADLEGVEEHGQRLRVAGAWPARDHQRVVLPAVRRQHGYMAQIQHVQDIGIAHFILEGESDHVELAERFAALQREQRQVLLLQPRPEVHPGHKNTLAAHIGQRVDQAHQDLHAQVGHADLVRVRKAEGEVHLRLVPVPDLCIHFPARIPGRLFHLFQKLLNRSFLFRTHRKTSTALIRAYFSTKAEVCP